MKLPIAYYTDPVLRKKTERVEAIDDSIRSLISDMIETMHAYEGVGLAAPQIHHSLAIFVTCVPIQKGGRWSQGPDRVFINPSILGYSEETQTITEGCLSIPNFYINVTRPASIQIQATTLDGSTIEETLSGYAATNFMHEFDHLNGILIVDRMSVDERRNLERVIKSSLSLSENK